MGAAPPREGRIGHVEEIGDILQREAVAAELSRLIGEGGLIAVGG
ncbi:MAG: hypothetical protein ABI240_11755 [Sphingomonas sp.]